MNKLAIVGSHPDTRGDAPFSDNDYDIWVQNEAAQAKWCKRWTACIQLHLPEIYTSPHNMSEKTHWAWLQEKHGRPIYMQNVDPRIPDSVKYPLEEIEQKLLQNIAIEGQPLRWFTSTSSYALALALYLGYEEVHIYGIQLTSNTEYGYQAANWRFWTGIAVGRGVKLEYHSGADLFTDRLYGYEGQVDIDPGFYKNRARILDAGWASAEKNATNLKRSVERLIENQEFDKVPDMCRSLMEAAITAGTHAGALAEAEKYGARETPVSRQEYERTMAQAAKDRVEPSVMADHTGGKMEYVWNAWKQSKSPIAEQQLRQFIGQQSEYSYKAGAMLGIMEENHLYMNEIDDLIRAAGGSKAIEVTLKNGYH